MDGEAVEVKREKPCASRRGGRKQLNSDSQRSWNEKDWKLFRSRLPGWQERHMETIVEEYKTLLSSDEAASDKFWALHDRIKKDQRDPGVLLRDVSRSRLDALLPQLLGYKVIRMENLDGFSEELRDRLAWFMKQLYGEGEEGTDDSF